jgi:ketosteroid isomerase-like protein
MTAFPDLVVKMDRLDVDGSRATYRWTLSGTNAGPGGTGKAVRISGHEEWRIGADGLIAESRGHFDKADYERQLTGGAPPAPQGAASAADGDAAAHQAHEAYVTAINSNDLDTLLAMLSEDVVFLSAHEPVMVGKAAVRPWLEEYLKAFKTHWDKPVKEFVVSGDWAFERYSYRSTDTPRAGGPVVTDTGWGLVVYHHDADGKWRVARDAWGPDHPVPAR